MKKRLFTLMILFVVILTGLTNCQETKTQLVAGDPPVVIFPPTHVTGKTLLASDPPVVIFPPTHITGQTLGAVISIQLPIQYTV